MKIKHLILIIISSICFFISIILLHYSNIIAVIPLFIGIELFVYFCFDYFNFIKNKINQKKSK